jgi:hypothetical protein
VHTKWVGDSPSWASTSTLEAFLHLLARVVLLPFLALLLIVAPFSTLANRLSSPVNRLVSHLAAYLVFLALVTVQGHVTKNNFGRTATGQTHDHFFAIRYSILIQSLIGIHDWIFSARTGVQFDHEAEFERLQEILDQHVSFGLFFK